MPRNVRNFWIEAQIDGRKETLAGGPKAKDGGFTATVKMRHGGIILDALKIVGYLDQGSGWKDTLRLEVDNLIDDTAWFIETRR